MGKPKENEFLRAHAAAQLWARQMHSLTTAHSLFISPIPHPRPNPLSVSRANLWLRALPTMHIATTGHSRNARPRALHPFPGSVITRVRVDVGRSRTHGTRWLMRAHKLKPMGHQVWRVARPPNGPDVKAHFLRDGLAALVPAGAAAHRRPGGAPCDRDV